MLAIANSQNPGDVSAVPVRERAGTAVFWRTAPAYCKRSLYGSPPALVFRHEERIERHNHCLPTRDSEKHRPNNRARRRPNHRAHNPDELLERDGTYADLWAIQTGEVVGNERSSHTV